MLSYKKPFESAAEFIRRRFTKGGYRTLHRLDDQFLVHTGTHYENVSDERIKGAISRFLQRPGGSRARAKSSTANK